MTDERRLSPRIPTHEEIVFWESDTPVRTHMLNVGSGGIFIKTDKPLALDSEIAMRIHLPDDDEVMDIRGCVVWINHRMESLPAGMGIQFTQIAPEHSEKIKAFVEARCRELQVERFL